MRIIADPRGFASMQEYVERLPQAYTHAELVAMWGESALRSALRRETVQRLLPNAYVATRLSNDPRAICSAVTTWCPRGLITGYSALHAYEPTFEFRYPIDLVVPRGVRVRNPAWVRVRTLPEVTVSSAPGGVECVPAEHAVLEAWHRASTVDERVDMFYRALWSRVCTPRQIRRVLEAAPRVADRRRLSSLLDACDAGATSPLEVMAKRQVFRGSQFSAFEWQAPVRTNLGMRWIDMFHRAAGVAVELDGDEWHSTSQGVQRDRVRDAELLAVGIVTLRLGYHDLKSSPQQCRQLVLDVVNSRLDAE